MCTGIFRFTLVVLNFIFALIFLAVAIVGALLKWNREMAKSLVDQYLVPLIEKLEQGDKNQINSETIAELINDAGGTIGLVLFVIGLILTFICILGMFGACCKSRIMLILYCILMSVLIIAQVAFVVIYFVKRDLIFDPLKKVMEETITKFKGFDGKNAESFIWNIAQVQLACCGVNDYKDFENANEWKKTQEYKGQSYTLMAPITCCKFNKETFEREDPTCPQTFTDVNSNWKKGCFVAFENELDKIGSIFMYVAIGIIVVQVLLVLLAIWVIAKSKEDFDDDSFYDDRRSRGGRGGDRNSFHQIPHQVISISRGRSGNRRRRNSSYSDDSYETPRRRSRDRRRR